MVHDRSASEAVLDEVAETQVSTDNLDVLESELDRVRKELEETKMELESRKQTLKLTHLPLREVDADEMVIVKRQSERCVANKAFEIEQAKQKKHDNEMVTGRFSNRRAPGNSVKLTYMKYVDDPVKWYVFEDGKVYTIPRGFADQINEYYYRPGFVQKGPDHVMDPNKPMSAISEVDTSNKLYMFSPVNF